MRRALDLAYRGWGRVHPNPMVGAVVLSDGAAVGEGFHAEFGGPHAEAVALASAGERARGGTLVVTLEPCRHEGKQPACADLVLASGVRRVVIAARDRSPNGGGAEWLRAHGLEVDVGLLGERAEPMNAAFHHRATGAARPFVAVKLATSLDHRIADPTGISRWISGEAARDFVHWHRAGYDAIAVGGKTAVVDNPMLTVRGPVEPRLAPRRVVFLGSRRLAPESDLVRTARSTPTLVVTPSPDAAEVQLLRSQGVEIVGAGSLSQALEQLSALGIGSMVVEGGGRLAGALLAEGLADRFVLVLSPVWLGDRGIAATRGWEVPSLLQAERWTLVDRKGLDQDTLLVFDRP